MRSRRIPLVLVGAAVVFLSAPTPLVATREGRISGKVTDAKGAPLADVKVTITTPSNKKFRIELVTLKDGTYATFLIDATRTYHYVFEKAGYASFECDKKVPTWPPAEWEQPPVFWALYVLDVRLVPSPRR